MKILGFALGLALFLQPTAASAVEEDLGGGWSLDTRSGCDLMRNYPSGDAMSIYAKAPDAVTFMIMTEALSHVKLRGTYDMGVGFDDGDLWELTAIAGNRPVARPGLIADISLGTNDDGDNFVLEFATAKNMSVWESGKFVRAYRLDGSLKAVARFSECLRQLH